MVTADSLRLLMPILIAIIGGVPPSGRTVFHLESLGKGLGAAADAIGKLGDSIAHLISLGSQGYNTIEANRTRKRLKDIDARLVKLNKVSNLHVVNTMREYIGILEAGKKHGMDDPGSYISMSITASWDNIVQNAREALSDVTRLLSDLYGERSDFVLEKSYGSLMSILHRRGNILARLRGRAPITPPEIDALRGAAEQYDRLRTELASTITILSNYLRHS